MSRLIVWWDGDADGALNMSADECLAIHSQRCNEFLVRVYGWTETTVSIGAFQKHEDLVGFQALHGVPIVRRPSGGGAIVHGSDLTYAASVPKKHILGSKPQLFYDVLHKAMVDVLCEYGVAAAMHRLEEDNNLSRSEESFFCFDRRAVGDVVTSSHPTSFKLMGSSQRRLEQTVLQHGSLLLRRNPDTPSLARHIGVTDLLGESADWIDCTVLSHRWLERVAENIQATLVQNSGSFAQTHGQEIAVAAARFRDKAWIKRR